MTETYERDRFIDRLGVTRELRGTLQALWVIMATGEHPDITYGWRAGTCIDQYDDLNAIGRFGVRTAPTAAGFVVAFIVGHLAINDLLIMPSGWLWLPVAYLTAMWLLLTFYDPLAGLYLLLRGNEKRSEGVSA